MIQLTPPIHKTVDDVREHFVNLPCPKCGKVDRIRRHHLVYAVIRPYDHKCRRCGTVTQYVMDLPK